MNPPFKGVPERRGIGQFYRFFDHMAGFITSMAIVILVMIPFMGYRYYEFFTLFDLWLPIADLEDRTWAARLISVVPMDYGFAHLFDQKWKERTKQHDLSTLEDQLSTIEQNISEREHALSRILEQHDHLQAVLEEYTCPHCKEIFPTGIKGVRAHIPNCKSKQS